MFRPICGIFLCVVLFTGALGETKKEEIKLSDPEGDKKSNNSPQQKHDVVKRSTDFDTETKGRFDPCFNSRHIEIDNYERSLQIQATGHESVIDDGRIPFYWYRFTSGIGGNIPTSCPAVGSCNTIYPIWMKGTIPIDDDEPHPVQMCVNDNSDPNCEYKCQDALVKNCTDYLVYKLRPAPTTYSAYCAGSGSKCPAGENSTTGFSPCEKVENIPAVPKAPTVDLDTDDNYFYGRCTLTDPDVTVEHDIRWIADGNIFQRQTLAKGETVARVRETEMSFRGRTIVGYHILCEVSARKEGFAIGSWFSRVVGDGFFLGFKFVNEAGQQVRYLTISEENTAPTFLYLKPSAPVRCNDEGYIKLPPFLKPPCQISVKVAPPDLIEYHAQLYGDDTTCTQDKQISVKQLASQLTFGTCQQNFTATDWHDHTLHKIPVFAELDRIPDGVQTRFIDLRVSAQYQRVWDNYEPPWVKVTIEDQEAGVAGNKICSSINDPHMTTFDGVAYENMKVGEFVLYENPELNFRVHAYFIKCNRDIASCNCGVAAQAGDDVILFDRCNKFGDIVFDDDNSVPEEDKGKGYLRQKVLPLGEMTPGFTLEHSGGQNMYKIKFPHGAELQITLDGEETERINLRMIPSQEDFAKYGQTQKVRGLCGTFSGDKRDDFLKRDGTIYALTDNDKRNNRYYPDTFSDDWRIPAGDPRSMYNGNIVSSDNKYTHKMCVCLVSDNQEAIQCQFSSACDDDEDVTGLVEQRTRQRRRRRDAEHDFIRDHDDSGLQFNPGEEGDIRPDERWDTTGMSKRDARTFCENLIKNAPFYNRCKTLSGIEFESDIDICIADIGLVRTTEYAKGALDRAEVKCKDRVESDMSLWTDSPNQPPVPLRYEMFLALGEASSEASSIAGGGRAADENDEFVGRKVLTIKHGTADTDKNQIPDPAIVNNICPQACNAQGRCQDGKCVCNSGWTGKACSFKAVAPTIYSIPQKGLCNKQNRPCAQTPVTGKNFIPSENLRCVFTLLDDRDQPTRTILVTKAVFESYQEIHCPTPTNFHSRSLVKYNLQVNNDQRSSNMLSAARKLQIFDNVCYTCTVNGCSRINTNTHRVDLRSRSCVQSSLN